MKVGFFLVLKKDPQHYLHGAALVNAVNRHMPGTSIVQFTDATTPAVPWASVVRVPSTAPLLDQRLAHYAACTGNWLLLDTDVHVQADVRGVFADVGFDVALCDRNWYQPTGPLVQGDEVMHTMPFNTGVVFSRSQPFWRDVYGHWLRLPQATQDSWLSEQIAVYAIVRTGRYRVKILPGQSYNYPPASATDVGAPHSALVHYKGPRKPWLSAVAVQELARP